MPGALPIILAAGAVVLLTAKKKKRRKRTGEPDYVPGGGMGNGDSGSPTLPGGSVITARPAEPKKRPKLGESCGEMSDKRKGIYSAYGKNGECVVFWKWGESDLVVAQYIRDQIDELGVSQKKACATDVWEEDPFNLPHGRWVPNPTKEKVLKRVLKKAYPQIPEEHIVDGKTVRLLPPTKRAPYYVQMIWKFSEAVYDKQICGYVPVT